MACLCGTGLHASLAQERAEGMAKGMNVYRPAAFVLFVDLPFARRDFNTASYTSSNQVTIENLDQPMRHGE